jgi:hypothetical protein
VLTALAGTVRIDGAFEAVGIAVMFLLSRPKARDWTRSLALLLPVAAVGGYMAYLKDITGDWLAWFHAEQQGWSRRLTNPVTAFRNSWNNAFGSGYLTGGSSFGRSGGRGPGGAGFGAGPGGAAQGGQQGVLPGGGTAIGGQPGGSGQQSGFGPGAGGPGRGGASPGGGFASAHAQHGFTGGGGVGGLGGVGTFGPWPFRLDILVVCAGIAFVGWAAFRRRWAELAYVGIPVLSMATSTYYMSVAREALLWWPVWIALAIWLSRRRWLTGLYIVVSSAMMVGISWLFLTGGWAG